MPRYSYVNGSYVPHANACVHIEDRGYQFADGVYEVIGLINGKYADERGHFDRLERSLNELQIAMPAKRQALRFIMRELIKKNRLKSGAIYIQVTRGVSKRDFKFPKAEIKPSLVMICWPFNFDGNPYIKSGVKAITVPDQRWERRDIKTVALLPQALAKQKAAVKGAYEAIMIKDGYVTEGSSSNFWILKGKTLKTHPATHDILKGITRTAIEKIAKDEGLTIKEERFKPEEIFKAEEAFFSSATSLIVSAVNVDGKNIGNGKPGPIVQKIYEQYRAYANGDYSDQIEWSA